MRSEWITSTIDDICKLVTDGAHNSPKSVDNGYYMASVKDFTAYGFDFSNCRKISEADYLKLKKQGCVPESGDILVGKDGARYFEDVIIYRQKEQPALLSSIAILRVDDTKVTSEFLYYTLKSPAVKKDVRDNYGSGSAIPRIVLKDFKRMPISFPSLKEQKKITNICELLDEKIQLNNRINNNLEQQAQLLFKSWFVDFEPFNGTMPSDWEVVPFEKIVDFQNGYAFKSKELLNEPSSDCYQVFKQGHIARGGGFIPDGTKSWYPKKLASKLERFVLKKGDILMAMTDMKNNVAILGNTAIMPIDNEYIVNQRVGHLRVNGYKGITYPFIYLLTNSTDFLIDLRSRANSGVQVNLSSAEIKASQTVLPSEKVNTAFSEITFPMFEAIISNQLENQRLAQLRDTLLPKLMSGELDVSDIDL